MSKPAAITIEKYLQIILFALSGFLFLVRDITLEKLFSLEGIITILVLILAGFYLYERIRNSIVRIIRRMAYKVLS